MHFERVQLEKNKDLFEKFLTNSAQTNFHPSREYSQYDSVVGPQREKRRNLGREKSIHSIVSSRIHISHVALVTNKLIPQDRDGDFCPKAVNQ